MKALVSADELAKDVAGAESMIQSHKERKGEIDAQEDSFKASSQFGQSLISTGHYESEQVKEIVSFPDNNNIVYMGKSLNSMFTKLLQSYITCSHKNMLTVIH